MALTRGQKAGLLRGLGDLAKAFVEGADEAKRKQRSTTISGPSAPEPKPGCNVCGKKKRAATE